MESPLVLYVYRVSESEYGVGFGKKGCVQLGQIVEEWPIRSASDARFVAKHGTAYWKASEKVSRLADLACELLTRDPTFVECLSLVEAQKPAKARPWWLAWLKPAAGESR